jgi:hypothetical protein
MILSHAVSNFDVVNAPECFAAAAHLQMMHNPSKFPSITETMESSATSILGKSVPATLAIMFERGPFFFDGLVPFVALFKTI